MAIQIGHANDFIYSDSRTAIRETHKITIQANGTINESNIELGNQGDDGVTILDFDISKLKNVPLNTENKEELRNRYQPVIICRNSMGVSQTFDFDGKYFYVPNAITKNAGTYKLVYAIIENENDTAESGKSTEENVEGNTEVFTSSIFTGIVKPTNYSLISFDEPEILPSVKTTSLVKPAIKIKLKGSISNNSNNLLGYKLDKYMSYLQLQDGFSNDYDTDSYVVYFTGTATLENGMVEQITQGYYFERDDNDGSYKCWVPPMVTANPGIWELMIIGYTTEGHEYVSNVFTMPVVDNELVNNDDLDADTFSDVPLLDVNTYTLQDANEKLLYVTRTVMEDTNYSLNYTGSQIQALLDKINNSVYTKEEIDALIVGVIEEDF